jgi:hypothetical protein
MTVDDYDLMLHCTIGHLRRVEGALPDFDDGKNALNLLAPPGEPRYIFCIFCVFCIFCILMISLLCADTFCAGRSQSTDLLFHDSSCIHLQKILPRFVPRTDAEVDVLLGCKLRVYVLHILHILYILHILILIVYQAGEER